jgi:hypothetical protein
MFTDALFPTSKLKMSFKCPKALQNRFHVSLQSISNYLFQKNFITDKDIKTGNRMSSFSMPNAEASCIGKVHKKPKTK